MISLRRYKFPGCRRLPLQETQRGRMKYSLLALLVLTAFVTSCAKKSTEPITPGPKMPKATQTGQNIVACRVNGNIQIYTGPQTYLDEDGVSFGMYSDMGDLYVSINASGSQKYDDDIYLDVYDTSISINTDSRFSSTEIDKVQGEYIKQIDGLSTIYRSKEGGGVIRFTRYDNEVVAGTFSFAAYKADEKVNVTEGFFDIKVEK